MREGETNKITINVGVLRIPHIRKKKEYISRQMPESGFERMDALLKHRPEFIDYMSKQRRLLELQRYDARIVALSRARATLNETPIYRLLKADVRSAATLCLANDWTKEDAAFFIEDFQKRRPPDDLPKIDKSRVVSGVTNIASALMHS